MKTMGQTAEAINKAKDIAIFPHVMADGDAVGSAVALKKFLNEQGKPADVVFEEQVSYKYQFLLKNTPYIVFSDEQNRHYDTAVALDSGEISMLGRRKDLYESCTHTMNIDHHITNTQYADFNYVDRNASATGEILYDLFFAAKSDFVMPLDIAECLYVAIVTDTGGFKYANTTSRTHRMAACLLDIGIDSETVFRNVFDCIPKVQLALLQAVLPNIKLYYNDRIGTIKISKENYNKSGGTAEHSERFIDYVRNIEGVQVAAAFKEISCHEIKVSFRSDGDMDVSKVAAEFQGGGHPNAAGCTLRTTLEEAEIMIVNHLKRRMRV